MPSRRGQLVASHLLAGFEVVKPCLTGLEARYDRVRCGMKVFSCMLAWGAVTAAHMAAFRTASQVQPPAACGKALNASISAWCGCRVNSFPFGLHRRLRVDLERRFRNLGGRFEFGFRNWAPPQQAICPDILTSRCRRKHSRLNPPGPLMGA